MRPSDATFAGRLLLSFGAVVLGLACNALLGLDQLPRESSSTPGAGAGGAGAGAPGDTLGAGGASSDSAATNGSGATAATFASNAGGAAGAAGAPNDDGGVTSGAGTSLTFTECVEGETSSCAEAGSLGRCAAGTRTCQEDGTWGECSIEPLGADSCEKDNDDDCNGMPNEGCECLAGAVRPCLDALGNCAGGSEVCGEDGTWGACDVQPLMADTCDSGDDANCNGVPNEACPCVDGQTQEFGPESDTGVCERGLQECVDGHWQVTEDPVYPSSVDCTSSEDNDCDGRADQSQLENCACIPGSVEVCDAHPGLDGEGICQAGSRSCVAGPGGASSSWGSCSGAVGPRTELCNTDGIDEDCDGNANDSCSCLIGQTRSCPGAQGICAQGIQTCTNGGAAWSACSVTARAESCNGLDDNCDGSVDNGVCRTCLALNDQRTASSAYLTLRDGDREFASHGPTLNLRVTLEPDGRRVCATVYTRMRETESNSSLGDNTRIACSSNAPGDVVEILSPNYERSTTLSGHGWHLGILAPSGVVEQVDCVGDDSGDDICSDKAPPDCALCYVNLGCVDVIYSP